MPKTNTQSKSKQPIDEISATLRSGGTRPDPEEVLALFGLPVEDDPLRGVLCQSEEIPELDEFDTRADLADNAPGAFSSFAEVRVRKILEGGPITPSERRLIEAEITGWRLRNGQGTTFAVYRLFDSRHRPIYVVQAASGGGPDCDGVFYGPFTSAREVDLLYGRSGWFPPGGTTDDELLAAARKRRVPITRFTRKRKPSVRHR
jgi:hypothetical protein